MNAIGLNEGPRDKIKGCLGSNNKPHPSPGPKWGPKTIPFPQSYFEPKNDFVINFLHYGKFPLLQTSMPYRRALDVDKS